MIIILWHTLLVFSICLDAGQALLVLANVTTRTNMAAPSSRMVLRVGAVRHDEDIVPIACRRGRLFHRRRSGGSSGSGSSSRRSCSRSRGRTRATAAAAATIAAQRAEQSAEQRAEHHAQPER